MKSIQPPTLGLLRTLPRTGNNGDCVCLVSKEVILHLRNELEARPRPIPPRLRLQPTFSSREAWMATPKLKQRRTQDWRDYHSGTILGSLILPETQVPSRTHPGCGGSIAASARDHCIKRARSRNHRQSSREGALSFCCYLTTLHQKGNSEVWFKCLFRRPQDPDLLEPRHWRMSFTPQGRQSRIE